MSKKQPKRSDSIPKKPTIEQVKPYGVILRGIMTWCNLVDLDEPDSLENAHAHVFERNGGCAKCQKLFRERVDAPPRTQT